MSKRLVPTLGLAAAAGVGYYLYTAGGDPKVAQKQAEADAHKLSAKISNDVPKNVREAEARGEAGLRQAGDKFDQAAYDAKKKYDSATAEGKAKLDEARRKAEAEGRKVSAEFNKGVDKFDATVTQKASEAKSGLSSWFGGK